MIKNFFKKVWKKICQFGRWVKRNIKKVLIGTAIAATITTPIVLDQTRNEVSLEKLTQKYEQSQEIKAKYQLDGVSLKRTVKDDPKDRIEVQIGNASDTEFTPSLKISRWDEVDLTIKPKALEGIATKDKNLKFEGDKIKFETPNVDYLLYELPIDVTNTEGGFEYEVILKSKPKTNVIQFTLQDKDVEYFYQPELTAEEIAQGALRPENVIGSYAVYAKTQKTNWTGGKEYKCGKVGHIYRPKIIDSAGTEVWGDLHIENGILSVTIPQDFLDKAVYPVRHAAGLTFGYDTAGGTPDTYLATGFVYGSVFNSPANITPPTNIKIYSNSSGGGSGGLLKGLLVLYSTLNLVSNGVGGEVAMPTSANWATSIFATPPTLTASTNYIIGTIYGGTQYLTLYHDTGDANQGQKDISNSYTTPQNLNSTLASTNKYSIYATYTAAGPTGGTITTEIIDE